VKHARGRSRQLLTIGANQVVDLVVKRPLKKVHLLGLACLSRLCELVLVLVLVRAFFGIVPQLIALEASGATTNLSH